MMNKFRKSLKSKDNFFPELDEEEYGMSEGCCFFHDEDELKRFVDIDDDEESKGYFDNYDNEEQEDFL
ncbi:MAG: hypothetical protein ACFFG0_09950 [Candidatus Thorarchaeota archaeon]